MFRGDTLCWQEVYHMSLLGHKTCMTQKHALPLTWDGFIQCRLHGTVRGTVCPVDTTNLVRSTIWNESFSVYMRRVGFSQHGTIHVLSQNRASCWLCSAGRVMLTQYGMDKVPVDKSSQVQSTYQDKSGSVYKMTSHAQLTQADRLTGQIVFS